MMNPDLFQWLLMARTPSIRYLTLHDLLDCSETDAEVQAVRQEMRTSGPIPAILAKQTDAGCWAGERGYYTPKYTSTHWSMLLLAELAADRTDPRLQRGAALMLAATAAELAHAIRTGAHGISCFWGNVLRYALHCGQADAPRVRSIVHYLAHDAREADWRCPINDKLPCAWGTVRALWGLAALRPRQHSAEAEATIQDGLAFLLEAGYLMQASYPTPGRIHPLWFRLNFPLFYQADILFVLRVLSELGALSHPGAQPALAWLAARRRSDGRWRGSSPFRQRTYAALGDAEETDRWVSLQAAIVLRSA